MSIRCEDIRTLDKERYKREGCEGEEGMNGEGVND